MNIVQLTASALLALAASMPQAQVVKGNEAVKRMADGSKQVETPPLPLAGPARRSRPCAIGAGCSAGTWYMVETREGLEECTEPYARSTTCRRSTYGAQKLARLWMVRKGRTWLWCQYPDLASKCVDMNARPLANLPYDAVQ